MIRAKNYREEHNAKCSTERTSIYGEEINIIKIIESIRNDRNDRNYLLFFYKYSLKAKRCKDGNVFIVANILRSNEIFVRVCKICENFFNRKI